MALTLKIGDSTSTGLPETYTELAEATNNNEVCEGLLTEIFDGGNLWAHCTKLGDAERQIQVVSKENKIVLRVTVKSVYGNPLGLKMAYVSEPVSEVIGPCEFGWVALGQFCMSAMENTKLPWSQAEMECVKKGGHLASIRNDIAQNLIDDLLLNR